MNTIYIDTSKIQSHQDAYELFKNEQLKKGDEVHILTMNEQSVMWLTVLILIAIMYYFHSEQKTESNFGQQLLDDLFGDRSTEEIEKEIEDEYGITIKVEHKDLLEEEWTQLAAKGLAESYSEEEPDYSDVELKESNPDYQGPARI